MRSLIYVTGNQAKFDSAQATMRRRSFELVQKQLPLEEIQAESGAKVCAHKAQQAFDILKQPVVVSDSSWLITALHGFPGPYMHSLNQWFKEDDWLRLMHGVTNREIVLEEFITYCAGKTTQQFRRATSGVILETPQPGKGTSLDQIVSLTNDGRSIAAWHETQTFVPLEQGVDPWDELADWLTSQ